MDMEECMELFEIYCDVQDINGDHKVAVFITQTRHEIYKVLRDLFATRNVKDQAFKDLNERLIEHFATKTNVIAERYKFHSLRQSGVQTTQVFAMEIKTQAMKCAFGSAVEDMIRGHILIGVTRKDTTEIIATENN